MSSRRRDGVRPEPALTPRDVEIIRTVCQHGALKREQLRRLFFRQGEGLASVQAVCRRLKILTERGYLDRLRIPTAMGSGPYVYLPGARSEVVLESEELALARVSKRERLRSVATIAHRLEVADFYVGLREAFAARDGRILVWLSERQAYYALPGTGRTLPFTPDAYCLWTLDSEEGAFFLEWDRGTESMTRLAEKLARYETYYGLRAYRDHLGEDELRPRVLFVVPDERRRRKLSSWLGRRLIKREWPSLPTVLAAIQADAEATPLGAIWYRPGDDEPLRLVD
jgi:hypothetical protein